jgi:hypothetical protein
MRTPAPGGGIRALGLVTFFALALGLLGACKRSSTEDPPPPAVGEPVAPSGGAPAAAPVADVPVSDEDRACSADADCALTSKDCCGCRALGENVGVRKDRLEAVAARRAPICREIVCAMAMSEHPSCSATRAVCRDGLCVPETTAAAPGGVDVERIP